MEQSPNLRLPYLMPSQAQKHVTHNEALDIIDALAQLAFESATTETPPGDPVDGARFLIPDNAEGAWEGRDGGIACWRDGTWVFLDASEGTVGWVKDQGVLLVRHGGLWQPAASGASGGALTATQIGVNAAADATNRMVVASDAVLLTHASSDLRMKLNKAAAGNTCSILFQSDFGGRAEIGLTGDDDLHMKVSADGSNWNEAMVIPGNAGPVRLPVGMRAPGQIASIRTARKTDTFTTTSGTPVSIGLSIGLTPESIDSRFLIRASVFIGADFWQTVPGLAIYRDETKIWPAASGLMNSHQALSDTPANSGLISLQLPIECEDVPATTDSVTYSVRMATMIPGYSVHVNRRNIDGTVRGESNMSVMEISG